MEIKDKNGVILKVGDVVRDKYGYDLIVSIDSDGCYFGKLVCDEYHSCKDIPYSLNSSDIIKINLIIRKNTPNKSNCRMGRGNYVMESKETHSFHEI